MRKEIVTLYKYMKLEYALEALKNQRLYLNDGSNFNDPFEVTITDRNTHSVRHVEGLHILSLTNSYQKKKMWSYYADSHKGVCLTVEVPKFLVHPLCYTSQRVYENSNVDKILAEGKYLSKKNVVRPKEGLSRDQKIAFIKDKKWSYEREYRLVFDRNDEDTLIYESGNWYFPVKITNVYLGAMLDFESVEAKEVIDLCSNNKISFKRMALANEGYSIKIL